MTNEQGSCTPSLLSSVHGDLWDTTYWWIPCLYVLNKGHGVGKALITAAEEEARRQSRKAVVTIGYRHDFWFMPASFFETNGFSECEQPGQYRSHAKDRAVLLWKVCDEHAEAPLTLRSNYKFRPIAGKVVIDLFWNTFCQTSDIEAQRVREVAVEFGDRVALNEYCADDRAVLSRHQISGGIFINGREIGWGYEAPKDGVREAIVQALRGWECDSKSLLQPHICVSGMCSNVRIWKLDAFQSIILAGDAGMAVDSLPQFLKKL